MSYPLLYNTILLPGFSVFIFKIGITICDVSVFGFLVYSTKFTSLLNVEIPFASMSHYSRYYHPHQDPS